MLQVSNLSKRYGDNLIFEQVNFVINARDRIGVVGPNGCGKTTLLRILVGEEKPDTGSVQTNLPPHEVGYLAQALVYAEEATVREVLAGSQELDEVYWAAQVQALAERLTAPPAGEEWAALEQQYTTAIERLSQAATQLPEHRMARVLAGLGLDQVEPSTPVRILSGGQKTRLSLARLLLQQPALLLLDEPTNHLDITALEWLEGYLRQYDGAILIVSHDRTFLDRTVTSILELNPETHRASLYAGNYSVYAETKERERVRYEQMYKEQQERIAELQSGIRQLKNQARNIENETIDFYYSKRAKKVARQAIVRQKRLERMLNSEDHLDKPRLTWHMKLEFVNTPPSGQDVLILEGLSKRFGENELFHDVNLVLKKGERVVLVGPNGSGKTTLLRIILGREAATSGTVQLGANVQVGYFSQEQENLDWTLNPLEAVRQAAPLSETEARSFLHYFLFAGDDVFVPIGTLSYGERARLALGLLVLRGCNLLLLDEPINHLDIPSRENFERALQPYEGTVLAVVHDRYFIEHFASSVWALQDRAIRRYVDLEAAMRERARLAEGLERFKP